MYKILILSLTLFIIGCGKKETPSKLEEIKTLKETPDQPYTNRFDHLTQNAKEEKLWETYKKARETAKGYEANMKYNEAIDELLKAAECAVVLKRHDVAAQQFNDAAEDAFKLFKHLTDYENRDAMAQEMKRGDTKDAYIEETRSIFAKEKSLLLSALHYLKEANRHDDQVLRNDESRKERKERERTIERNFNQIRAILVFATAKSQE